MDDATRRALGVFLRGRIMGPLPAAMLGNEVVTKAEREARASGPPLLDTARTIRKREARQIAAEVRKAEGGIPLIDSADRRHAENAEIAYKQELQLQIGVRMPSLASPGSAALDDLEAEFDEDLAIAAGGRADRRIDARALSASPNPSTAGEAAADARARSPRIEPEVSGAGPDLAALRAELAALRSQLTGTQKHEVRKMPGVSDFAFNAEAAAVRKAGGKTAAIPLGDQAAYGAVIAEMDGQGFSPTSMFTIGENHVVLFEPTRS